MRLLLDSDPGILLVRSYGDGAIVVGERRVTRPCIITPQALTLDWQASSIEALSLSQLEPLLRLKVGIVILGAGESHHLAPAEVRSACRERSIALECMSLGAACRTYNILANEQRAVAAGLFP